MKVNNTPLQIKTQRAKQKAKINKNISFQANPLLPSGAKKGILEGLGSFMKNSKKYIEKLTDFDGMSMTHQLLVLTTFGFVNVPRVMHARTKDERREILFRDYATVATICFAFPTLNKLAATAYRKAAGIVCSFNDNRKNQSPWKRFKEHFRLLDVSKGDNVLPNEGIKNIYTQVHKHKGGITGFFKYIDDQKGNINKMLKLDKKNLDKPLQEMIETYKKATGKSFDGSNKAYIEMFEHAFSKNKDLLKAEEKDIYKKVETAFKKAFHNSGQKTKKAFFGLGKLKLVPVHNKFVQKALFGTKMMGALNIFIIIPGFLGLCLPWINEKVTKNKYTNPKKIKKPISKNTIKNVRQSRDIHFMNSASVLNEKQKQIFKDFIKTPKQLEMK